MNFSEKEPVKLNIQEVFPKKIKEMIGNVEEFTNLEVDPDFGQKWNLLNLTNKEVYVFANKFYRDILENLVIQNEFKSFYKKLLEINPELKNINSENLERDLDIVRGVGSGLHFNDIKYFVEDLKGTAENEKEEDRELWTMAYLAYMKRNGFDFENMPDEDVEEFMETEEYFEVDGKIGFVFSKETLNRIIENKPY